MTHRDKPLVLHIDDDALSRLAVARSLQPAGFAVAEASDATSGLASAVHLEPDLVLLDLDLPDVSGQEVCKRLRADPRTRAIPVTHLSAEGVDVDWRADGVDACADACLVQPVDPAELVATLRALLRLRRTDEDARRLLRQAKAIPRVREDALRAAAWELSGPVSTLRIAADGLAESLPSTDSVARARVDTILGAARSIDRVLAALVDLARADARPLLLPRSPISVADALAVARKLAPRARLHGSASNHDVYLRCDPSQFHRILGPVLQKVASEQSHLQARISIVASPGCVLFSVTCDDSPAASEDRDKLFEPYWSRPRSRRRPDLEIALAKALVEAHGGQMWAAPTEGRSGLSVHFTLPTAQR